MKYRNIVISGEVGTGTSTLARLLAAKLNYQVISVGAIFRQYVLDHQIEFWDKLKVPKDWEYQLDSGVRKKLETEVKLIVDGHYAGYLSRDIPDVFRILLVCTPTIAEKRILRRIHTHKETVESIKKRRQGLKDSFKKLYGDADYFDPKLFNIVIDTGVNDSQQTLEKAYANFVDSNKDWC